MLELKTYSKKELGKLLNVSYSRTDIITKKLKKWGTNLKLQVVEIIILLK